MSQYVSVEASLLRQAAQALFSVICEDDALSEETGETLNRLYGGLCALVEGNTVSAYLDIDAAARTQRALARARCEAIRQQLDIWGRKT